MIQFLWPSIAVAGAGLLVIFARFWLIGRARKHQGVQFEATDETRSWTPFRNRVIEFVIVICGAFASFYGSYSLQKYKSLVARNNLSAAICFSAQNKVGYFDSFLRGFGVDTVEDFSRMLGA